MPITFGSVGDIIATFQLAWNLLEALNASRGAAREFQDLVKSLRIFHRLLAQIVVLMDEKVIDLWPVRSACPQLDLLYDIINRVVLDCQSDITTFLENITSKYGKSLAHSAGSRRSFKDMGKMLQWHMFEGGSVTALQKKLDTSHDLIMVAYISARGVAEENDHGVLSEKLDMVKKVQDKIEEDLGRYFDQTQKDLSRHTNMLEDLTERTRRIESTIPPSILESQFRQIFQELRLLNQSIPSHVNPSHENIVILEDAFGNYLRLPRESILSWKDHFVEGPGKMLVRTGQYVLQDSVTGHDVNMAMSFGHAVRPGGKLVMTMVFYRSETEASANTCPRCKMVTISSDGKDIKCGNAACDVTFRRVKDEATTVNLSLSNCNSNKTVLHQWKDQEDSSEILEAEDTIIEEEVPPTLLHMQQSHDGPEIFKRIRLITRWQEREDFRGSYIRLGSIFCWDPVGAAQNVKFQLYDSVRLEFQKLLQGMFSGYHPSTATTAFMCFNMFFIGKTVRQSFPVMVIYCREKTLRRRTVNLVRSLPWYYQSGVLVASITGDFWRRLIASQYPIEDL